jgi:hypothetical protein
MATALDLCNHALVLLGERPLSSLDDRGVPAQVARTTYVRVRDTLLAERPWHWTRRFADLPRLAAPPASASGHSAAYQLPSPCYRVVTASVAGFDLMGDWSLEAGHLLCSVDSAAVLQLEYHGLVDESAWPAHFCLGLTYRLAAEFAVPIADDIKKRDLYLRDSEREMAKARHQASTERPQVPVFTGRLAGARGR